MKVNVLGLLTNAAAAMEDVDGTSPGGYSFALRELARNLAEVALHPDKWEEFAKLYSLNALPRVADFLEHAPQEG